MRPLRRWERTLLLVILSPLIAAFFALGLALSVLGRNRFRIKIVPNDEDSP